MIRLMKLIYTTKITNMVAQRSKKMATTRSSYLENFSTAYSLVVNCLSITNV